MNYELSFPCPPERIRYGGKMGIHVEGRILLSPGLPGFARNIFIPMIGFKLDGILANE